LRSFSPTFPLFSSRIELNLQRQLTWGIAAVKQKSNFVELFCAKKISRKFRKLRNEFGYQKIGNLCEYTGEYSRGNNEDTDFCFYSASHFFPNLCNYPLMTCAIPLSITCDIPHTITCAILVLFLLHYLCNTCAILVQYLCSSHSIICAILVQYLCNTCAILVQYLCNTCEILVLFPLHNLCNTCATLVQYLCMTCAILVHDLCNTCATLVHYLCMTCATLVQYLCNTCAMELLPQNRKIGNLCVFLQGSIPGGNRRETSRIN
jgi:hypothetical protein